MPGPKIEFTLTVRLPGPLVAAKTYTVELDPDRDPAHYLNLIDALLANHLQINTRFEQSEWEHMPNPDQEQHP